MAILPPDPLFCMKSDMGYVHSLCFKDNKTLLAATESGFVYFWDLERNRVEYKQQLGESIQAVHIAGNGQVITQEKKGILKSWVFVGGEYKLRNECPCEGGYCRSIMIRDGILIAPCHMGSLQAVELENMKCVQTFVPSSSDNLRNVTCLQKVEQQGSLFILSGYESGHLYLWDYRTSNCRSKIQLHECITTVLFDPQTNRGVCGNPSNMLQVFTIDSNLEIRLKCELALSNPGCNVVKLRQDRKIFACGGWDGYLRLFSWKSLRLLAVLTEHQAGVTDVAFCNEVVKAWNSKIMAVCGADGVISLWNLYN